MSLFLTVKCVCAQCETAAEVSLCASVNADLRDDLRQAILDGTFQAETCRGCGGRLRLPAHLSYLNLGRDQWILVEGAEDVMRWREAEEGARDLFDRTYGGSAPAVARELGAALRPRLVFGWPALREKLRCRDLGIDDLTLELLKIAIIRGVPEPPLGDTTELRLIDADAAQLRFAWVDAASEAGLAELTVGRDLYDDVAADPDAWAVLRRDLAAGPFVDLKRLVFA